MFFLNEVNTVFYLWEPHCHEQCLLFPGSHFNPISQINPFVSIFGGQLQKPPIQNSTSIEYK